MNELKIKSAHSLYNVKYTIHIQIVHWEIDLYHNKKNIYLFIFF